MWFVLDPVPNGGYIVAALGDFVYGVSFAAKNELTVYKKSLLPKSLWKVERVITEITGAPLICEFRGCVGVLASGQEDRYLNLLVPHKECRTPAVTSFTFLTMDLTTSELAEYPLEPHMEEPVICHTCISTRLVRESFERFEVRSGFSFRQEDSIVCMPLVVYITKPPAIGRVVNEFALEVGAQGFFHFPTFGFTQFFFVGLNEPVVLNAEVGIQTHRMEIQPESDLQSWKGIELFPAGSELHAIAIGSRNEFEEYRVDLDFDANTVNFQCVQCLDDLPENRFTVWCGPETLCLTFPDSVHVRPRRPPSLALLTLMGLQRQGRSPSTSTPALILNRFGLEPDNSNG